MSVSEGLPAPDGAWFDPVARFLGPAYLRNAFTMGTDQEVEFLVGALGLEAGMRVLDGGCGPGRHALALARRGIEVVGVDRSGDFIELATGTSRAEHLPARFVVGDVRALPLRAGFHALVCLCQGGFGLLGGRDERQAFAQMVGRLRPGGRVAISGFSAAFAIRHLEEGDDYDVATGVFHETATVRNEDGGEQDFDLWTTCFTPRELELLAAVNGITVEGIHGVAPGSYGTATPGVEHPEILLVGRRTDGGVSIARDGEVP